MKIKVSAVPFNDHKPFYHHIILHIKESILFFHQHPLNPPCQKDWVYEPEMGRCAPGPPIFELAPGNPASGDNADNATQVEDGS